MNIVRIDKFASVARLANEIEVDTLFTGTIGTHTSVFLKIYDAVVDLRNPRHTWNGNSYVLDFVEQEAEPLRIHAVKGAVV